ncbi:hypothetical protein KRX57_09510 [Weeksellaceae bacterium TAE3-ERU29]|nr:hypothetical protein [Weeksellaceae bacterium TAE3-ERU29]
MKKYFLLILLLFSFGQILKAQEKSEVLIIEPDADIALPKDKLVKKLRIKSGIFKKSNKKLLRQCVDSTKYYRGNCFKVTYYDNDDDELLFFKDRYRYPDYIRGEIYTLDEDEFKEARKGIEKYNLSKIDTTQVFDPKSVSKFYRLGYTLQYGGESMLSFIPKVSLVRVHNFKFVNPYYGAELGINPLFVSVVSTFSGIVGVEKGIFSLETSFTHLRTTKIKIGEETIGPFNRNLINLKLGVQIKNIRLKIGTSSMLNGNAPEKKAGEINGRVYGIEVQFNMSGLL